MVHAGRGKSAKKLLNYTVLLLRYANKFWAISVSCMLEFLKNSLNIWKVVIRRKVGQRTRDGINPSPYPKMILALKLDFSIVLL
jgi:hypothetical protein